MPYLANESESMQAPRCTRHIALFPGAFRPPHRAHFAAVCELAQRADIDEVVIIITNRVRHVPGTSMVLDTDVAEKVWAIYTSDMAKVRVETATDGAVTHALEYLRSAVAGDRLLFCIGEEDFNRGDPRFTDLEQHARGSGIKAQVIPAATGHLSIRATSLRRAIGLGEAGRAIVEQAMPEHLNSAQRERVWHNCCNGLKPSQDVTRQRVHAQLRTAGFAVSDLRVAKAGKRDEVFKASLPSGDTLFVKYANDTVAAATWGDSDGAKPRGRLRAERRAIKWLRTTMGDEFHFPIIQHVDKRSKTLVLSEVLPGGRHLSDDLSRGCFDELIAEQLGRLLALWHAPAYTVPPLWGEQDADTQHWRTKLRLHTAHSAARGLSASCHQFLCALQSASDEARKSAFMHLDLRQRMFSSTARASASLTWNRVQVLATQLLISAVY